MQIDGVDLTCLSARDGKPIKNKLPAQLKERMRTENQWLEAGFLLKPNATGYEMYSNSMGKKLFTYYIDDDVEAITENNAPENCMTCKRRIGRFCIVAGDYVSAKNRCSEYACIKTFF